MSLKDFIQNYEGDFESLVYDLVHLLKRQHPIGVSTWSTCQEEGCNKTARGGHTCSSCILSIVGDAIGDTFYELLLRYKSSLIEQRECINAMITELEAK